MAVELATAYINILPSTSKLAPEIKKALPPMEQPGKQLGDGLLSGIGKTLKVGAIAIGATAAAGIGVALTKGFSRLDAIDQATAKLTGLGHSTQTVDTIMGNALASVKGTAFGLGDAATVAAQAVAAGIKPGQELETVLNSVANAAAASGSDLGSMGSIYAAVASSGRAYNDTLGQLSDRGIPIYQELANQLGVSTDKVREMASAGEIGFEQFQTAAAAATGTVAAEMGGTFTGSFDNAMAAVSRLGEGLLQGVFPQMTDGIGGITTTLDNLLPAANEVGAAFGAWVSDVGPKVIPVLSGIGEAIGGVFAWIGDNLDLIKNLAIAFGVLAGAVLAYRGVVALLALPMQIATAAQIAWNIAMNLNPIGLIITAIIALVAAIVWVATQTTFFQDAWAAVSQFFIDTWTNVSSFFTTIWTNIVAFFQDAITNVLAFVSANWGLLLSLLIGPLGLVIQWIVTNWTGIVAFFSSVWSNIVATVTTYINAVKTTITTVVNAISVTWSTIWNGIGSFFSGVWTNIINTINTVKTAFSTVFNAIGSIVKSAFDGVVSTVKSVINGIIDAVNGVIGGINGVAGAIGGVLGVELQIGKIPRLAKGGIVSHGGGGIIANVGEGRYDEAVVPLNQKFYDALSGGSGDRVSDGPSVVQHFTQQDPVLAQRAAAREYSRLLAS